MSGKRRTSIRAGSSKIRGASALAGKRKRNGMSSEDAVAVALSDSTARIVRRKGSHGYDIRFEVDGREVGGEVKSTQLYEWNGARGSKRVGRFSVTRSSIDESVEVFFFVVNASNGRRKILVSDAGDVREFCGKTNSDNIKVTLADLLDMTSEDVDKFCGWVEENSVGDDERRLAGMLAAKLRGDRRK